MNVLCTALHKTRLGADENDLVLCMEYYSVHSSGYHRLIMDIH